MIIVSSFYPLLRCITFLDAHVFTIRSPSQKALRLILNKMILSNAEVWN